MTLPADIPAMKALVLEWAYRYVDIDGASIPVPFKRKVVVIEEWSALRLTHETVGAPFYGELTNYTAAIGRDDQGNQTSRGAGSGGVGETGT